MQENKVKKDKGKRFWFKVLLFLLPRLVTFYFRLIDLTTRKVWLNLEYEDAVCKKEPFTCACFHGTMLSPGLLLQALSGSGDGEPFLGWRTHRQKHSARWGTTPRGDHPPEGGKEALWEMIDAIKERNYCSGLAVDAPRGAVEKGQDGHRGHRP